MHSIGSQAALIRLSGGHNYVARFNPILMNIKRIVAGALPAIALSMMPSASFAASSTTKFAATVSNACTFVAEDNNAALNLSSDKKSLVGSTDALKINCNYGVVVGVTVAASGGNAAATTDTAVITDGEGGSISADSNGRFPIGNANGVDQSFKLKLTAADDGGAVLSAGSYSYDVTMTLIDKSL